MGLIPALRTATPGQRIRAADFNANFDDVRATVNAGAVFVDVPRIITALQTFAGGASFTGGILDVTGATLAGFPNFARRDQANVFTQPITVAADLILPRARFAQNGNNQDLILSTGTSVFRVVNAANTLALFAINDAGVAVFAGNVALPAGNLTVNGPVFAGGGAVVGADPGGTELLRIGGAMRVGGALLTGGQVLVGPAGTGRIHLTPSGGPNTGFVEFIRPDGTRAGFIGFAPNTGGADAGVVQYAAGTHQFSSGNVAVSGSVTASIFSGSGAGLSSVPWGALIGAPASFPPSAHGHLWGDIAGVPSNVVSAITQSQADARYRQLGAVLWSDLSGVPANVSNAITQAQGDARYRPVGAVLWSELTGVPDFARRDQANTFTQPLTFAHATQAFVVPTAFLASSAAASAALTDPVGVVFGTPAWRWIRCTIGARTGYVPVLFDDAI